MEFRSRHTLHFNNLPGFGFNHPSGEFFGIVDQHAFVDNLKRFTEISKRSFIPPDNCVRWDVVSAVSNSKLDPLDVSFGLIERYKRNTDMEARSLRSLREAQ